MSAGTKKGLKKMSAHVGPNMTPMVDIVMCILIFFMLGSSFSIPDLYLTNNTPAISQKGLGESDSSSKPLPSVQNKLELRKIAGQTKVFAFGQMIEDLDKVLPAVLTEKQQQLSKEVQIIIVPEKAVKYQDVITVYEACMKAHFGNVAFGYAK